MTIATLIEALDVAGEVAAARIIEQLVRRRAVPALLVAARDRSRPRIRKWSLAALGRMREGTSVLIEALEDERMTIRLHALRALATMKHAPATRAIERLLRDPSGGIRVNAIDALVTLHAQGTKLVPLLSDERWYVRQHAARACGLLRVRSAMPILRRMATRDPRQAVRSAALEALSAA